MNNIAIIDFMEKNNVFCQIHLKDGIFYLHGKYTSKKLRRVLLLNEGYDDFYYDLGSALLDSVQKGLFFNSKNIFILS